MFNSVLPTLHGKGDSKLISVEKKRQTSWVSNWVSASALVNFGYAS